LAVFSIRLTLYLSARRNPEIKPTPGNYQLLVNDPPAKRTILVIDDEPSLRFLASALLEDMGYASLEADSGRAAVQLFLQDPDAVDAVLLDMTMPGMTPEEIFRQLREIRPDLPVIILSGHEEATVRTHFGVGTIAGCIQKPYTDLDLEATLATAFEQPLTAPPAGFNLVRLSTQELDELKKEYLQARKTELPKLAGLLAAGDFQALQIVGHTLKGSSGCFGFSELTQVGEALVQGAVGADPSSCGAQIRLLTEYLEQR